MGRYWRRGLGIGLGLCLGIGVRTGAQPGMETQLQQAVQGQNGSEAIQIIDQLLETDPPNSEALQAYRRQLEAQLKTDFRVLYEFSDEEGTPIRLISGQDGALYGVTSRSLVFRLSLDGDLQRIFQPQPPVRLDHPTSRSAQALFLQAMDGNFYGVGTTDPPRSGYALG